MGVRQQLPDRRALVNELALLGRDYPRLKDHELFVVWFVFAYITGDRQSAVESLTGGVSEKGIDALHIDRKARAVSIVQGRYAAKLLRSSEPRRNVEGFAAVAQHLLSADADFADFCSGLEPIAKRRAREARRCIRHDGFRLALYFATLNRVSRSVRRDAAHLAKTAGVPGKPRPQLVVPDGRELMTILADYLDGVAPPVPRAELLVEKAPLEEFDTKTGVSSWSFAVSGLEIARLFDHAGRKLFARNIRGFLGEDTTVNREMRATLKREPAKFWYLNNGITIICDAVSLESEAGQHRIALTNPQIINGQQTTYALTSDRLGAAKARVSVRAIGLPRTRSEREWVDYEAMVANVVRATNSQNQIRPSDLRSNDRLQVRLERNLHKRSYHYQRKRAARGEVGGQQYQWSMSKYDIARAVMTCESSTTVHNKGREVLFEDPHYERIFDRSVERILCHVWLYRLIDNVARGNPEWQSSKYVVVEFMWDELSPVILQNQQQFIAMSETGDPVQARVALMRAARRSLLGAVRHFRVGRGRGSERIEITPFFKQRSRYEEFRRFWRSRGNPHRSYFVRAKRQFEENMRRR